MSLAAYKKKRDFQKTPEPAGRPKPSHAQALHYVIQKHDASRLHYDFRLEWDGTLKSWAVPKGPSLDPGHKSLAVQVEDHPLEYETFEGIIPKGQYGGGTVMVWDQGTWEPLDDAKAGLRKGKLRFRLHGKKLQGIWSLVRMHGPAGGDGKNWLLIKTRDEYSGTQDILSQDTSVKSKRTLQQIAGAPRDVWNSHRRNAHTTAAPGTDPMPEKISPQLATPGDHPPQGEHWLHEIKFDGYRLLAFAHQGTVTLRTRSGQDWTAKFTPLAKSIAALQMHSAIIDGEVIALNHRGGSDFQLLQSSFKNPGKTVLHYAAFDLLFLDGQDLRDLPLQERKHRLQKLLQANGSPPLLHYSEHIRGDGAEIIRHACALGSEGIISKRDDAPYVSRRDPSWIKSKCTKGQEFVIIGYVPSTKRADGLRSLLLGVHDDQGKLVYCGRVGTGFDAAKRKDLLRHLKPLEQPSPPTDMPPPERERRAARWVKPALVCEAHFEGWTRDNVLRHPSFTALRTDKPAREIIRETPVHIPATRDAPVLAAPPKSPATKRRASKSKSNSTEKISAPSAPDVRLTHPDKLLYPAQKITKQKVADYYHAIAPFMLPHVIDRPLALIRCPAGLASKCFFMRNWSSALPHAIRQVRVPVGENEIHIMIHDEPGLLSLVQISALEIHAWNCTNTDILHPDQLVFDLDPGPGIAWMQVIQGALTLHVLLENMGLRTFVKTSGGKGVHITVPIAPNVPWAETKKFCKTIADHLAATDPLFIANMRKDLRHEKIYLDYLRNERGSTAVAPYSTRARDGAAVSMPLSWEALKKTKAADQFTLSTAPPFVKRRKSDPWAAFAESRVDLRKLFSTTPSLQPKE